MKPVRLPAAAVLALPRWALVGLGMLYILPGLIGRGLWKDDAASFGIMWTMAQGSVSDWLMPNVAGLAHPGEGPLAFWLGALCIKLFGWLLGDLMAARLSTIGIFIGGVLSVWYTAFHLGRRPEAQPLRLAFGGQPEPDDYGRTLADTAVLIYIGCLGLLMSSHLTLAVTLQGSLLAFFLFRAVRYVELPCVRNAVLVGLSLGLLTLTRGFLTPCALLLALFVCSKYFSIPASSSAGHMLIAGLCALLLVMGWVVPAEILRPYGQSPIGAWLAWNASQLGLPTYHSLKQLVRVAIWYSWPAWPFAGWAVYAWRRQSRLLHIVLPLSFVSALLALLLVNPAPENGDLLKILPPLAIMGAFGLPTMKRGAINAIDWFSVMVLTMVAGLLWLFWIAKLTGWPAKLSHNVLKLMPGFAPQFEWLAFAVALTASLGWLYLVWWRLSRQPSVLWRAVVLSSGGVILMWVLVMTLFLPDLNYSKSYEAVSKQLAGKVAEAPGCIDTNLAAPQRAAFAYHGGVPFAGLDGAKCDYVLLQYSLKKKDEKAVIAKAQLGRASVVWEGRRAADRDERFRLHRRSAQ
jgi:4-amino-4-deoxy-L-arabinose transferase-like glycosyltransferase